MSDPNEVSVDEFMDSRKAFVRDDGSVVKAVRNGGPKSWDKEARTVEFVMSAEVEDRDNDIIVQAGLNIERFIGENPVALPMHNHRALPIGKWTDVTKNLTGRPRRTEGKLHLMPEGVSQVADEIAAHFDFGSLKACSIGFLPSKVKRREVDETKANDPLYYPGWLIEEAELLECSVVNIPANPAALAKHAAFGNTYAKEMLEEVLDNWAKHPETGLIVPRSEFEDAWHKATRERIVTIPASSIAAGSVTYDYDEKSFLQSVGQFFGLTPKGPTSSNVTPPVPTVCPQQSSEDAVEEALKIADEAMDEHAKLEGLKAAVQEGLRRRELKKRAEAALKRAQHVA
jgi:phage head maturation protease